MSFCIFYFLLQSISCTSPSDEILKEFDKIEKSMDSISIKYESNTIDGLYKSILKNKTSHKLEVQNATLIYRQSTKIIEIIKNACIDLQMLDSSGENLDKAYTYLSMNNRGINLYRAILNLYKLANKLGHEINPASEQALFDIPIKTNYAIWLQDYFKDIPTVAATTILNKFNNDCKIIAEQVLSEIKKKIEK